MSEANFWKEIKKNVGHLGHWTRIESHATADGFPDTVLTIDAYETKIELKHAIDKVPEIRPSQVRWFRKNVRNGGKPWVFAKIEINGVNNYFLIHGYMVQNMYDKPLEFWLRTNIIKWEGKIDWNEFIKHIRQ